MGEVGIVVFRFIKIQYKLSGSIRDGGGWFSASVAVNKSFFTLFPVDFDQPVYLPFSNAKGQCSPIFITIFVNKLLDYLIFLLFIHV